MDQLSPIRQQSTQIDNSSQKQYLIALDKPLSSEEDFKNIFKHIKSSQFQSNRISSLTFQYSFILENNLVFHRLFCILFTQIHQQCEILETIKLEDLKPFKLLNEFISYCDNKRIRNDYQTHDSFLQQLLTRFYQGNFQKEVILNFFQQQKDLKNTYDVEQILQNMYQTKVKLIKNEDSIKNDIINGRTDYDYILCDLNNTYAVFFPSISKNSEQIETKQNQEIKQVFYSPSKPSSLEQQQSVQSTQESLGQKEQSNNQSNCSLQSSAQSQQTKIQPQQKQRIRCEDCRKPIDMTLSLYGNQTTRCMNCFEIYLTQCY